MPTIRALRLLLAATVLAGLAQAAVAADDLYTLSIQGRYDVEPSKVAPDILAALVATVHSLRGETDLGKGVTTVALAKDAKVVAGDKLGDGPAFSYDGYALAGVRLHRLAARRMLRSATTVMVEHVWQSSDPSTGPLNGLPANPASEQTTRLIFSLAATSEAQALLKTQALQTIVGLAKARDRLYERAMSRFPPLLIGVLIFLLVIIFTSFSLFSPLTRASIAALVIIAVCAAAALFLILEMGEPFRGFMQISKDPLVRALRPL